MITKVGLYLSSFKWNYIYRELWM